MNDELRQRKRKKQLRHSIPNLLSVKSLAFFQHTTNQDEFLRFYHIRQKKDEESHPYLIGGGIGGSRNSMNFGIRGFLGKNFRTSETESSPRNKCDFGIYIFDWEVGMCCFALWERWEFQEKYPGNLGLDITLPPTPN